MEHCSIIKETLSPNNPEGIFQEGSYCRRGMFFIIHFILICLIVIGLYFLIIGIGLLTSLTVWYPYDIHNGCKNQTCSNKIECRTDNSFSIYGMCFVQGVISSIGLTIIIFSLIAIGYFIYKITTEFQHAYERTKKRSHYEEV